MVLCPALIIYDGQLGLQTVHSPPLTPPVRAPNGAISTCVSASGLAPPVHSSIIIQLASFLCQILAGWSTGAAVVQHWHCLVVAGFSDSTTSFKSMPTNHLRTLGVYDVLALEAPHQQLPFQHPKLLFGQMLDFNHRSTWQCLSSGCWPQCGRLLLQCIKLWSQLQKQHWQLAPMQHSPM